MAKKVERTEEEWRARLPPDRFAVCRLSATEPAFSGRYWDHHEPGTYLCAACGEELFRSEAKFDSGTGWPSFFEPAAAAAVETAEDGSHGMRRTEVRCASCGSHLGHVFPDGPAPTGLRYCINSLSLEFRPAEPR